MTRSLGALILALALLASLSIVARGGQVEAEKIPIAAATAAAQGAFVVSAQAGAIEIGIDPETTGNTANTLGTLESCARVDVPSPSFDDVSDYNIDVYVKGDSAAPLAYDVRVTYDQTKVHITAPGTDTLIKMPGAPDFGDAPPDSDGHFTAAVIYFDGQGIAGDGILVRLGLDIGAPGVVTFGFAKEAYISVVSDPDPHPVTTITAQLAINENCPGVMPTPTPTPTTPVPPTTLTSELVAGWNHPCSLAQGPIEDVLADLGDRVLAVYRLRADQGYDRWFPGWPLLSTIDMVGPYEPLFVLMSDAHTWTQQASTSVPASASLMRGWNDVCYAGATKSVEDATVGINGQPSVLYMLGNDQAWRRYVPARPELSNIGGLNPYDSLLILVTSEEGAIWTFDP